MTYSLTWLPKVLEDAGLKVEEAPDWATRGHGDVGKIYGVLCHHTNGAPTGNMPTLPVLIEGRPDLAGPLSQLGLGRDGTYYIIAAGKGWHAGAGEWKGLTDGNSHLIGIEAENVGDGSDPWPEVQMDAYKRGVTAILDYVGATSDWAVGHKEWAPSRKDDPNFDMDKFREDVRVLMTGRPSVPKVEGESGKGSWYSQYKGKYTWVDTGDKANSNALGVPDWAQGVAFYNRETLGDWFEIQFPNGTISIEQQTDIGPAPRTGRSIDISAAAAERAGYSPNSFPTDSIFHWRPIPTPALVEAFTKKDQAVAYAKQRLSVPVSQPTQSPPPVKPKPKPITVHTIEEAFAWAEKEHLKVQGHLLRLMNEMQVQPPQSSSEWAELIEEVKPVLLANMGVLLPLIGQLQPSTIGKLVALGLAEGFGPAHAVSKPEKPIPQPQGSSLMTQDQIMSAVRWAIATFGGAIAGWAAAKGWVNADTIMSLLNSETFIGIVVAGVSLFLGQKARTQNAMLTAVAAMPEVKQIVATKEVAEATPSHKVVDKPSM